VRLCVSGLAAAHQHTALNETLLPCPSERRFVISTGFHPAPAQAFCAVAREGVAWQGIRLGV
jgi:hypothetical protein